RARRQVPSTPHARGVPMPSPVTTTRLICRSSVEGTEHQAATLCHALGWGDARRRPGAVWQWQGSAFCVLLEEFHGIADGQDGLRGIIGNFAAELLLEGH